MYLSSNSKEDAYSQSPGPVDGWMLEFWERRPDGASECALGCYHALAWDLGDGEGTSGESGKCSAKFLVKYIHKMLSDSFCFKHQCYFDAYRESPLPTVY